MRQLTAVLGLTAWMTLCDRFFHVATHTVVHYWHPFMGAQTVWVVPIFALASIGIASTSHWFASGRARPSRFTTELLVMTLIYASSGFLGRTHPVAITGIFTALFAIRLICSRDRAHVGTLALALALAGPAFESLQWHLGMFAYTQPDVAGVPWWLIPFYANGAWAIRELGALLKRPDLRGS